MSPEDEIKAKLATISPAELLALGLSIFTQYKFVKRVYFEDKDEVKTWGFEEVERT